MLVGTCTREGAEVWHLVSRRHTALCGAGPVEVAGELGDRPRPTLCRACAEAALRRPELVA